MLHHLHSASRRSIAAVTLASVLTGVGVGGWLMTEGGAAKAEPETLMVTARPLVSRLSVVGTIEPGAITNVASPLDGAIKEKLFDFGQHVESGQILLVMETTDIEVRFRDAQVAALRAERIVKELNDWGNSPEAARARHGLLAAKLALEDVRHKAKETKMLLDRGIVPRMEWEALDQQIKTLEFQQEAAKRDLDSTLEKGSPANHRIAELELQSARARLTDLQRQLDGAMMEAPVAGIVLRPPLMATGQNSAPSTEGGSHVTRGQLMFSIAGLETLSVSAKVDEVDVNRLAEGQRVDVTGDAFGSTPLEGRITRISAQALPSSSGQAASFGISVEIHPAEDQRRRIRVGMSSTLAITLYENPTALVVPPDAIKQGESGYYVLKVQPGQSAPQRTPVVLGQATESGVEILDGIRQNDELVLR